MKRRRPAALLLTNIGQLLTLRGGASPRRGPAMQELGIVQDAAVLCAGGRIVAVGKRRDAMRDAWLRRNRKAVVEVDCGGRVALPGFVDAHTHPVFVAPRLTDFEARIAGASYEEIAQRGGGIASTTALVRKATQARLTGAVSNALRAMAQQGTTTAEAKSGYGLSFADEIKSLVAIRAAAERWGGTVTPTLLAHIVPREYARDRSVFVEMFCARLVPAAAKRKLAEFVDVFIERGAFDASEAEQIFAAARRAGLGLRAHVCQLGQTLCPAIAEMARRFGMASLDHMDYVLAHEVEGLAPLATVATLLPAANHFLGLNRYPPARHLIGTGVPVALATDFNPGTAPTASMPLVLSLACTQMRMTPAEAITAATINGAAALRLAERKGSLEAGKDADIAIFDVRDWREIAYWFGMNKCWRTIAAGAELT